MYTFPMLIGMIAPFVSFIAVTSIYGKIIAHNEVSVMFASGLSPIRVARPAIFFGVIITVLHLLMNLVFIPQSQDKFYSMQWNLRYGLGHLKLREATFNKMMDHVVIYVEEIRDSDMRGIMIRDGRGGEERIITAAYGQMVSTLNGMSIVMGPGGFQAQGKIGNAVGTFSGAEMDMGLGDEEDSRGRNPRRLSTGELIELMKTFDTHHWWFQGRIASEATNRFLSPLMNIMLVLVSLVFLLKSSTLRRKKSYSSAYASTVMLLMMTAFMSMSAGAARCWPAWLL
jgi:lipopolysaccharide export system permease protein